MGHSYVDVGGWGPFEVVKSNPTGNVVRFTLTDTNNKTNFDPKLLRAVLNDAIDQWITTERADLNTNADDDVKGQNDEPGVGDGFSNFLYNLESKYSEVTLTALTNIDASTSITATIPYDDVA